MERPALGEVIKPVCAATNDHFALVRLAHIAVHRIGHDHDVHTRFDRLRYKGLQRHRLDRQTKACHFGHLSRMTSNHNAQFFGAYIAFCGFDPFDLSIF